MFGRHSLAATGSTGNNTHAGVHIGGVYDAVAMQFIVEAAGATPTVTWKVQGSADSTDGSNGNWFDVAYVTDASDTTATAGRTLTAVGAQINFLANPVARRFKWFRLVTSANTNVTYRADAYAIS